MNLNKILKNTFLVVMFGLIVTACATKKSVKTTIQQQAKSSWDTKADPIEKLDINAGRCLHRLWHHGEPASGVPDRVFFATMKQY